MEGKEQPNNEKKKKDLKEISEGIFVFLVKRKKFILWTIEGIMIACVVFLFFKFIVIKGGQIDIYEKIEITVNEKELQNIENYLLEKEKFLVEKQKRTYQDLFR